MLLGNESEKTVAKLKDKPVRVNAMLGYLPLHITGVDRQCCLCYLCMIEATHLYHVEVARHSVLLFLGPPDGPQGQNN